MPFQRFTREANRLLLECPNRFGSPVTTCTHKCIIHFPVPVLTLRNHVQVVQELDGILRLLHRDSRRAAFGKTFIIIFKITNTDYGTDSVVVPMAVKFKFFFERIAL